MRLTIPFFDCLSRKILTLAEAEDEALGKLKPESHTGPVMALCVHNDNK